MEQFLADIIAFLRAVGPEVVFVVTLVETAFFIGLLVPAAPPKAWPLRRAV